MIKLFMRLLGLAGPCDVCGAVGTHETWCPHRRR